MIDELLSSQNAPLQRLSLLRHRLARGDSFIDSGSVNLSLFYVLNGTINIYLSDTVLLNVGEGWQMNGGPPNVAALPMGKAWTLSAITDADVLEARLAAGRLEHPISVRPADVRHYKVGRGNYLRDVWESIGGERDCELKCGETLNREGSWSSWPPHGFERKPELAPQFEECFYYFGTGQGYQRRRGAFVNGETIDDVRIVHPGDYLPIPLGEHPIVSAPDSQIGYCWFYYSLLSKYYVQQADGSWLYD